MGLLLALVIGVAIGFAARVALPRLAPRRRDVAIILTSVGAVLGALARTVHTTVSGAPDHLSPGSVLAPLAGALTILIAFVLLPRVAPSLTVRLPGRDDVSSR